MFIMSTVLIGTSLQMMLGPTSGVYLGASSQDSLSAKSLAESGMETVLADIQGDLNTGVAVTTSYSYSSGNITMPSNPTSLGGATTTLGSYTGSIVSIHGNTILVKVIATVGGATITNLKQITISRNNGETLDSMIGANVAYGLRKLRSSYNGNALRIRRSSDNAEQDIGFDSAGNLDMDAIRTFLTLNTLPVDSVGSAKVAFGLRKLRAAYTGYAIRVRRSSDNSTQDIGFNNEGDLDTAALLDFVGTGSGYVTIWYDQSGNTTNATQSTVGYQPSIVVSGQLNMVNNRPAIKYDGTDDRMTFSRTISDDFTLMACYSVVTGVNPTSGNPNWYNHAGLIDGDTSGLANDFGTSIDTSGLLYVGIGGGSADMTLISSNNPGYNDNQMHWMALARTKSSGLFSIYNDNYSFAAISTNVNSLTAPSQLSIASLQGSVNYLNGYVNEILAYSSVLSEANRQLLEQNEGWYFSMNTAPPSISSKPLDLVGTATAAYGLRQLYGSYNGNLIKVRRSSDNTTQDIGILSGNLDTASLMDFVGTGSGYVTTWYDQSGNGRNLTNAVATGQPRIVNAGVLDTQNNLPSILFGYGAGCTTLDLTTEITGINDYTILVTMRSINASVDNFIATSYSQNKHLFRTLNGLLAYYAGAATPVTPTISDTDNRLAAYAISRTSSSGAGKGYAQGAQYNFTGTDTGPMLFGRVGALGGSCVKSYVSEILLYPSVLSASNVTSLVQNQTTYFSPILPTAYVSKWYDQSGNGNDATQASTPLQPVLELPPYGISNKRPTISFNGSQRLDANTGMPINSDYTKTAVFSYSDSTAQNNIICSKSFNTDRQALWVRGASTPNALQVSSNGVSYLTSSLLMTTNTQYSVAATFQNSGKSATVYRNNVSGGTATGPAGVTVQDLSLGACVTGNFLKGTISEALIFNRVLSTTDRTTIYNDNRKYFGAQ